MSWTQPWQLLNSNHARSEFVPFMQAAFLDELQTSILETLYFNYESIWIVYESVCSNSETLCSNLELQLYDCESEAQIRESNNSGSESRWSIHESFMYKIESLNVN